jgi:peptidoglycan/LPS O-acetylase OafA/YrhL
MLASVCAITGWEHKQRMSHKSRIADTGSHPGHASGPDAARMTPEVRLTYSPGLDGLRAIAVSAVLLYHAELPFVPGGFLGVEVFFVISGYLITALLLAEWRTKGRISLKDFWLRRARRLLPALYVLLVVTLGYSVVFLPGEVAGLRDDAIAAVGYVTNWFLVLGRESYFESVGRPSVLQHLWSLAVEEQFYLIWPIVLAVGLGVRTSYRRQKLMLIVALAGAAASAVAMALMYEPGVDPSRVYFGTDTRATGLLCGAALAFLWSPADKYRTSDKWALRRGLGPGWLRRRWWPALPLLLDILGVAALAALVLFCLHLGEFEPLLYRGGLVAVALATALLIAVAVHPKSWLVSRLLGSAPMRWLGVRSYGIYLWHWPVFMLTRPELDVPFGGLALLALRLGLTILLADLSYRLVERPIRRGALGRAWKTLRDARGPERWRLRLQWAGAVLPILASLALLGVAVAHAKPPEKPEYLAKMKAVHTSQQPQQKSSTADSPAKGAPASPDDEREAAPDAKNAVNKGKGTRETANEKAQNKNSRDGSSGKKQANATGASKKGKSGASTYNGSVSAIGDSVMLGAVTSLQKDIRGLGVVDAEVGLQVYDAIGILQSRRAAGQLGSLVIVHLGNNGTFTRQEFDQIMHILSGVDKVVFVNVKVPRSWEQPNNEVISEGVQRYPNAVMVDWHAASENHPEYFYSDGYHLRPRAQKVYADLLSSHLDD